MNRNPHPRRFDRRGLLPAIGTDGAELLSVPDGLPGAGAGESTGDPAGGEIDQALEQFASDGCRVCPLCGAIVARDGSVMS
jgi:hypothetical protein